MESLLPGSGGAIPIAHELLVRLGPYAVEFRYLGALAPKVTIGEAQSAAVTALNWAQAEIER